MVFKIKKDRFRKQYEIIRYGVPVFTCKVEEFTELANTIVKYVVGKDFIISSPDRESTASGYGKYHFVKGFLLASWHDLKKYVVQRNKGSGDEGK
jgi:hypothetical protein